MLSVEAGIISCGIAESVLKKLCEHIILLSTMLRIVMTPQQVTGLHLAGPEDLDMSHMQKY